MEVRRYRYRLDVSYLGYGWLTGGNFFWQTITNQSVRGALSIVLLTK